MPQRRPGEACALAKFSHLLDDPFELATKTYGVLTVRGSIGSTVVV